MVVDKLSGNITGAAIEVHKTQLLTYLKLSGIHLGLILNFDVPVLRESLRPLRLCGEKIYPRCFSLSIFHFPLSFPPLPTFHCLLLSRFVFSWYKACIYPCTWFCRPVNARARGSFGRKTLRSAGDDEIFACQDGYKYVLREFAGEFPRVWGSMAERQ